MKKDEPVIRAAPGMESLAKEAAENFASTGTDDEDLFE
jgi:hypothetical protein